MDFKGITLVVIYVDDLPIASNSTHDSVELQAALSAEFQMNHLGAPTRFLGIQIERTELGFLIHQANLIDEKKNCNVLTLLIFHAEYWHAIGCLQYLVTCLCPDIAAPVSILSA